MTPTRAPMILPGQLYLHEELNEYMIVTRNFRGQVQYAGRGFAGMLEDQSFIERFNPVDISDVDAEELRYLESKCATGITARTGLVQEE